MASGSVNKIILVGHVGQVNDMEYTSRRVPVFRFTMATNTRWTTTNGDRQAIADWHNIVVRGWGPDKPGQTDACCERLKAGSYVMVEGAMTVRRWKGEKGARTTYEVLADNVQFLESRSNGEGGGKPEKPPVDDYDDGEFPF